MKFIFLDIDGVLNNVNTKEKAPSGNTGIEDSLIKKLADIIACTNARIILTSDWKIGWNIDDSLCSEDARYLNTKLKKYNLEIYGKTYDTLVYDPYYEDRGKGIHKYLNDVRDVESYVVLDDNTFTDFDEEIKKHLVLIDYKQGLSDEDVESAIRLLNNK
ncbi:hypothetical protein SAMN02910369_01674 [Lachnospiraceae bacterium NE2001]|nr:hypothetical protein SAMN02910369_01674 [Lachnospiraceae bacterium NE2001]